MQCQKCDSPATVHVTDLVKNAVTHLCAECAANQNPVHENEMQIESLLANLLNAAGREEEQEDESPACPRCGRTFGEFRRIGRFGCAEDYDAFADRLVRLVEKVQGADRHVGKRPRRGSEAKALGELERRLQSAVDAENYEEAARLRDLIREKRGN